MATSMTGFGKSTCQLNDKFFTIEVKSLNGKSLDIYVKLPQILKEKESQIRSILGEKLLRGKVDLIVYFENTDAGTSYAINKSLFKQYYKIIKNTAEELDAPVGESLISSILRMPDVLSTQSEEFGSEQWKIFENSLYDAIEQLISFRNSEGKHLKKSIDHCIINIRSLSEKISPYESERIEQLKKKLRCALESISENLQLDKNRFEQELIYYIEKLDINEEKVRLEKHLEYFCNTIEKENNSGKKLAFIAQEIGREINTIGSKAQHAEIQKIVIQMKDELEKIKEQLMNVL